MLKISVLPEAVGPTIQITCPDVLSLQLSIAFMMFCTSAGLIFSVKPSEPDGIFTNLFYLKYCKVTLSGTVFYGGSK